MTESVRRQDSKPLEAPGDPHIDGPRHVVLGGGSTLGTESVMISDAVVWDRLVFLSGRAPVDPATLEVVAPDFEGQATAALGDVAAALDAAGTSREHVLRVECFLARAEDFPAWNRAWAKFFASPRPARMTLVSQLIVDGALLEVQVTAGLPGQAADTHQDGSTAP